MSRLAGKTALVTGAASGIGRAITLAFLSEGAQVVALDIDRERLALLVDDHTASGSASQLITEVADVTDEKALSTAVERGQGTFGDYDVVVANAGRGSFSSIVDTPLEEWSAVIDLCLTGVFLTLKCAGRHLADGASLITIASLNAIQPAAGMGAYCAAKAGVAALTNVAALEFGARGIRANTIAPGLVETAASSAFWQIPGVVDEFVDNTTIGRHGRPEDVAALAVFLAGDESSFVSGSLYSVDGGASTKRYPDLPAAIRRLSHPHP